MMEREMIFWNINGLRSRVHSLRMYAQQHNPKIIALVETKTKSGEVYGIPGYTCSRVDAMATDNGGISGGIALYYRDLSFKECVNYECDCVTSSNVLVAEVRLGRSKPFIVCVVYRNPNATSADDGKMERVMNKLNKENERVMVVGDFNVWSTAFGDRDDNAEGKWLRRTTDDLGWHCVNSVLARGEATHARGHVLDL
jgi:exonuclease III